jgi:hypothetical protein
MSRLSRNNRFSALDDDAPAIAFAPSSLAASLSAHELAADLGLAPAGAAAAPPAAAAAAAATAAAAPAAPAAAAAASAALSSATVAAAPPLVASAPGGRASLDLAAIASEILGEARALPPPAAAAAWDFSGLATTAEAEARRVDAELAGRHEAHEARLAALASDQALLRDRLARSDHLARGLKRRRVDAVGRGEAHGGRLESKVFKRSQAAKKRNQAKGLW